MILKKALLENDVYMSGMDQLHGVLTNAGNFRINYKNQIYVVCKVMSNRSSIFDYEKDQIVEEYRQLRESGELDEIMKMRLYL